LLTSVILYVGIIIPYCSQLLLYRQLGLLAMVSLDQTG